ncbi:MAG TPA: HD-GYP domain-containing protein [Gemmataceae bacterium]|nr:HD-GYP domain-containing protein [Gemmataceae bacterium]
MLQEQTVKRLDNKRSNVTDQAKALAVVLREEFGVPFVFYDAKSGTRIRDLEANEPGGAILDVSKVLELAADGRARVTPLSSSCYQLSLLIYRAQKPVLLAAAEAEPLVENRSKAAAAREQAMLQNWLQAVSDRLRLGDQVLSRRRPEEAPNHQATSAWEALLALDQVARGLRVLREPTQNQQSVLESAFGLVPMQALIWAPAQRGQPVLCVGEPCVPQDQAPQLAAALSQSPDFNPPAPLLCNHVSATPLAARFPQIRNFMAFWVTDHEPLGWFVALNKKDNAPFRRSDAALVLPFVGLLELQFRWSHRYQDLKDLLVGLTRSLTTALDAKDTYTYGHSERVARTAVELGRELGLQGDQLGDIYLAGLLHDVGKIGIKDSVLRKQGPLSREEREHIQEHVTIGYWILAELRQIRNLLPGVLYHHERMDGSGYPDGLAGDNIPLLARILAVADAYDAMSHQRPYRDAMPYRRVEDILVQGAGSQWDKQVVDAFLRCRERIHAIRQRGVGDSLRQAIEGALRSDSCVLPRPPRLVDVLGPEAPSLEASNP